MRFQYVAGIAGSYIHRSRMGQGAQIFPVLFIVFGTVLFFSYRLGSS